MITDEWGHLKKELDALAPGQWLTLPPRPSNRWPDSVVEDEFRALEREVRQRDCPHEHREDIREIGGGRHEVCVDCGKGFRDVRDRVIGFLWSDEGRRTAEETSAALL